MNRPKKAVVELVNRYRSCFATNMKEQGVAKGKEMKIVLTNKDPVYIKQHDKKNCFAQDSREVKRCWYCDKFAVQ